MEEHGLPVANDAREHVTLMRYFCVKALSHFGDSVHKFTIALVHTGNQSLLTGGGRL